MKKAKNFKSGNMLVRENLKCNLESSENRTPPIYKICASDSRFISDSVTHIFQKSKN